MLFTLLLSCASDYEIHPKKPNVNPNDVTPCTFSPTEAEGFYAYSCNPVFSHSSSQWEGTLDSVGFHVTEVLGHPFYQLWYTLSQDDGYALGYAASADGVEWNSHPANPLLQSQGGAWDQDRMGAQEITWDAALQQYLMVYQGIRFGENNSDYGSWGMGVATSRDGVAWEKHPANPVLDFLEDFDYETGIRPCWPLTITTTQYGYQALISALSFHRFFSWIVG